MDEIVKIIIKTIIPFSFNLALMIVLLKDRRKHALVKSAVILSIGIVVAGIAAIVLAVTNFVLIWSYCYIVTYCIITLVICKMLFRLRMRQGIFLYFIFQSYVDDSLMISKAIQTSFLSEMDSFWSNTLSQGIVLLIGIPLLLMFIRRKMRVLITQTSDMKFWRYIWIMPVAFYLVFRMVISPTYVSIDTVWERVDILVPMVWIFMTIICYYLIIDSLISIVHYMQEKEYISQVLALQADQYEAIQKSVKETKRTKHDMRHQMLALYGYAQKGDMRAVCSYIEDYLELMKEKEDESLCANHTINALLRYYVNEAAKHSITIHLKADIPEQIKCSEQEISVLLGNVLENAIEACKRNARVENYIDFQMQMHNEKVVIQVKNSCNGEVDIRKRDGLYLSSKRGYKEQGLGLASVTQVVDKYHGILKIVSANDEFVVSIFI